MIVRGKSTLFPYAINSVRGTISPRHKTPLNNRQQLADTHKSANRRKSAYAAFICCLLLSGSLLAETIHAAVASNFVSTLRLLAASYGTDSSDEVRISAASTGKLFAQIRHGAPFHIFLSADARRPELLVAGGDAIADSLFTYAIGRLALWRPVGAGTTQTKDTQQGDPQIANLCDTCEDPMPRMLTETFDHLAMANPKTAPYGKAAEETLRKLGLWQDLQPRLVRGENIGQTYQFVASGAAEIGLVALSQIRGHRTSEKHGRMWIVPSSLHTSLRQQAVLLGAGADNAAAKAFLAFLKSPKAREIIRSQGYELPENG
ncbi:MAG: molybdate ABC transporter substrate-binding protein [Gammaproteobacteria bacterium]|nr:molybdate ABC transporter substrate-binding protein [Gammaproteobacteria bacterium]NNJ84187.1 molybdate ABC transporter substrate-binding protein [Gammaproteobacteria bacterium]